MENNQNEKMGRFICELRKEKKLTQKNLAEKLEVTDKAVSKHLQFLQWAIHPIYLLS